MDVVPATQIKTLASQRRWHSLRQAITISIVDSDFEVSF